MAEATKKPMTRYGMVIDVDRCTGCFNCFLACRDEHAGNDYRPVALAQPDGQSWIKVREIERGSAPKVRVSYVPVPCLHCTDAPCMRAAKGGAIYRRPDGIVIIDPEKAVGQRDIAAACPWGAIFWNAEKNLPQKCTFCAHLLDDGWKLPRCVEACPTQALVFGNLDDPQSEVSRRAREKPIEALAPQPAVQPPVGYFGLPARFVAGEIVLGDRPEECAQGVRITLRQGRQEFATASDNYGDFEFNGLLADAEYVLRIDHAGYRPLELRLSPGADANVGTLALVRAA